MADSVQVVVAESWANLSDETMPLLADWEGYKEDFAKLFGFGVDGVNYDAPTEVDRPLNA